MNWQQPVKPAHWAADTKAASLHDVFFPQCILGICYSFPLLLIPKIAKEKEQHKWIIAHRHNVQKIPCFCSQTFKLSSSSSTESWWSDEVSDGVKTGGRVTGNKATNQRIKTLFSAFLFSSEAQTSPQIHKNPAGGSHDARFSVNSTKAHNSHVFFFMLVWFYEFFLSLQVL